MISNLRTQAENNRALAEGLIEQQRKQQEASQALAQESVNVYMASSIPCSPYLVRLQELPRVPHGRRVPGGAPTLVGKRVLPRMRRSATR